MPLWLTPQEVTRCKAELADDGCKLTKHKPLSTLLTEA
jgi:hypothetical protein